MRFYDLYIPSSTVATTWPTVIEFWVCFDQKSNNNIPTSLRSAVEFRNTSRLSKWNSEKYLGIRFRKRIKTLLTKNYYRHFRKSFFHQCRGEFRDSKVLGLRQVNRSVIFIWFFHWNLPYSHSVFILRPSVGKGTCADFFGRKVLRMKLKMEGPCQWDGNVKGIEQLARNVTDV